MIFFASDYINLWNTSGVRIWCHLMIPIICGTPPEFLIFIIPLLYDWWNRSAVLIISLIIILLLMKHLWCSYSFLDRWFYYWWNTSGVLIWCYVMVPMIGETAPRFCKIWNLTVWFNYLHSSIDPEGVPLIIEFCAYREFSEPWRGS